MSDEKKDWKDWSTLNPSQRFALLLDKLLEESHLVRVQVEKDYDARVEFEKRVPGACDCVSESLDDLLAAHYALEDVLATYRDRIQDRSHRIAHHDLAQDAQERLLGSLGKVMDHIRAAVDKGETGGVIQIDDDVEPEVH